MTPKLILLIDDDSKILSMLKRLLVEQGYKVKTASNGKKGLKLVNKLGPDLIVLDMKLPGTSGVSLLKEISDVNGVPHYPVLVLTAHDGMSGFFENVDLDGFLLKPCGPDKFLGEVQRILSAHEQDSSRKTATPEKSRSRRVLIGEGDHRIRRSLSSALKQAGFTVDSADNGSDTIERVMLNTPDAIVLNVVMPKMDGDAVAIMLRDTPRTEKTPIVLYAQDESFSTLKKDKLKRNGFGPILGTTESSDIVTAVKEAML